MPSSINTIFKSIISDTRILALLTVAVLMVPNVALSVTETSAPMWKVTDVLLPLGFYTLLLAASRRTGLMALLSLPFMILAAFQIVLLNLYGESIIAVDMFLNVVTTNADEVNELLSNLFAAILTVVLLYLPPLILGVWSLARKRHMESRFRRGMLTAGAIIAAAGGVTALVATFTTRQTFHREVFPVNVCCNMAEAVNRTRQTARYPETSAEFSYGARSSRDAGEREIYLFVVGETSRAINWQLGGYDRPTNPMLSQQPGAVFCTRSVSESNTTHKSVPMLLSALSAENFTDITRTKSMITAMKEAGFHTTFLSNQKPNRSYTEFFGNEADEVFYSDFSGETHPYDTGLLEHLRQAVADTLHSKQFIVMHIYGSHFLYRDRYPREMARFLPDDAIDATASHRPDLINAYDNTVLLTDSLLATAANILQGARCRSGFVYSADHGEDIFDDERGRFLHASPHPTYYQLHVATVVWLSDSTIAANPAMAAVLRRNATQFVSPQKSLFHTTLHMAGVEAPCFDSTLSLISHSYRPRPAVYLTDLNTSVPLDESGIREPDRRLFKKIL